MLVQLSRKVAVVVAAATAFSLSVWGQAAQTQKNWKDRAEYDLYEAITKEANPNKKVEMLNTWRDKYPGTDFKLERLGLYFDAYRQLNNFAKVLETAKEITVVDPKNMQALFFIAFLTPALNQTAADAVDAAEKAANTMLGNLEATFAADKKPASVSEENWKKERANVEAQAHATAGWIAIQRKNMEAAETSLRKSLEANPASGQVALWLGQSILAQKKAEKQAAALFYFARSAVYDGPGSLPEPTRKEMEKYLVKVYSQYHGDQSGLDELRALAKAQALPPDDLKIESSYEKSARQEQEFAKSNPMLALWMRVKKELTAPGGVQYFESNLKGAALPGGVPGVEKLRGKLVSARPALNPKELVLAISDAVTAEVTLKTDAPLRGKAELGIEIGFEGVASAFTADPFNLTFDVQKDKLVGWKAAPAPAPVKKAAPGVKKAVPKKK